MNYEKRDIKKITLNFVVSNNETSVKTAKQNKRALNNPMFL